MRYLSRITLGELTGLDRPPEIRRKARELLALLEAEKTQEASDFIHIVPDADIIHTNTPLSL